MTYRNLAQRVPTVSTYNGVGGFRGLPTERTTEWDIPVKSPYDGFGRLGAADPGIEQYASPGSVGQRFLDLFGDEGGEVAEDFSDPMAPPKTSGGSTPPVTPAAPPKVTPTGPVAPMPNVLAAPPASSGGLSTMTLIGGGLAAVAVVGGLVYWKKSKGKR